MGRKRVSLDADDDDLHGEPFVTRSDYIKSRIDRDGTRRTAEKMRAQNRSEKSTNEQEQRRGNHRSRTATRNDSVSRRQQSQRTRRAKDMVGEAAERTKNGQDAEKLAVKKLVKRLQEKGASDAFIKENIETIRERAREELLE